MSPEELPFAHSRSSDVNAFVRRLIYNMDNCAGTNKSQYMFGCVAILVMLGYFDAIKLFFQLQGHTKFDPDVAAQKVAGAFSGGDTFNHGMLNDHMSAHVRATAYDERLLKDWRAITPFIFDSIDNITSYRQFYFLADDGKLNLGIPLKKALSPAAAFASMGDVYSDAVLEREAELMAHRSLIDRVLPSFFRGEHKGAGSGTGLDGAPTSSLVPPPGEFQIYQVRLFMRERSSDTHWIEQRGYMRLRDPTLIKEALLKVQSVVPGGLEGPKKTQVEEQYKKYIPPQYVPDEYEMSSTGCTGLLANKPKVQGLVFGAKSPEKSSSSSSHPTSSTTSIETTVRWSKEKHGPALLALCAEKHSGSYPKSFADRNALAKALNVKYDALQINQKKVFG